MTEQEIKPCPFCGQQFFVENAINGGVTYRHNLICVAGHDQRHSSPLQTWETVECMIEALNHRHAENVAQCEIESLRGDIADLRIKLVQARNELERRERNTCDNCYYESCFRNVRDSNTRRYITFCSLWEPRDEQDMEEGDE